jgi:leucyl aminopeptidase
MKVRVSPVSAGVSEEGIVLGLFEKARPNSSGLWRSLNAVERETVARLRSKEFTGAWEQAEVVPVRRGRRSILLVGLGARKEWNARRQALAIRIAVEAARNHRIGSLGLALTDFLLPGQSAERAVERLATEGVVSEYSFTRYRTKPSDGWARVSALRITVERINAKLAKAAAVGVIIGTAVNQARDLGNTPGKDMTPRVLAAAAKRAPSGLVVSVLGESVLKKLKMGGILGVAHGSAEKPALIVMEWHRGGRVKPQVFVGKGVTFDTGGLNLKSGESMYEMHMDMSGGAAVIAAMHAVAALKLPVNAVGIIPAVENMPGNAGYRPGDILKSMSGKTIEVLNTDAEGRIILADALAYAKRHNPALVLDVATLTGAAIVALGQFYAGLFASDPRLRRRLERHAAEAGEPVWRLPLTEEFEREVKGTFGDVANAGKSRWGGASTGAAFLWQFAKDMPWAHLDIAPTMTTAEGSHLAKGSAGAGVRLLIEIARSFTP